GVLSGAAYAGQVGNPHMNFDKPQNVGHLFLCFRPDLFMPMGEFKERMDHLVRTVKSEPKADGFSEILMPGERETRSEERRRREGIPLSSDVVDALNAEAALSGIPNLELQDMPLVS